MAYVDLHLHSYYSGDGEFTPAQLAEKCKEQGIGVMAIADHNSVLGNKEGREAAEKAELVYIDAIEIDCVFRGVNLHLLGYGIDSGSPDFKEIEDAVIVQEKKASLEMLSATQKLGFFVTEEEMKQQAADMQQPECWTGELFAEVLLGNPENNENPLLLSYRPGGDRSDNPFVNFYWDYYAQGKPCYVPIRYPSLERAVEIIHKNHGIAILAHPGINLREREELLSLIIRTGIDGLEAFSSYHTASQASGYYQAAEEAGILCTCGSDFHGKTKPAIHPGDTHCPFDDRKLWDRIAERLDCMK